ncbi:MAG: hypothetical protein KKA07_18595, partial [Bacteroidetes bacterium]|nr:hypothetical protein [Bacteroidota bacterium]
VTKVQCPYPDFVFDSDYSLSPLEEVEAFVKKYKHLPGLTPAAEVQANGLNLAENQADILQKTEELYLYLFEMNKMIIELQQENAELKQKMLLLSGNSSSH